jgi:uncharacterized membrane protein YkvA (DUF1232 family)
MMNQDDRRSPGFWANLLEQLRLGWSLLWDPRVPLWTKLIPLIGVLYILSPIDIIPDPILGLGQLDDLGVLLIGLRMFMHFVPEDVLRIHAVKRGSTGNDWRIVDQDPPSIDAEYEVKEEPTPR